MRPNTHARFIWKQDVRRLKCHIKQKTARMRLFVVAIFRLKISFQQRAEQYVPVLHLLDQLKSNTDHPAAI